MGQAVASLIANQASLAVAAALGQRMGALAQTCGADVVVGLPTPGMVFAPAVAQAPGRSRWVPMGSSRKFWCDDALPVAVQSITTPTPGSRLYLDPSQLPLLQQRRVLNRRRWCWGCSTARTWPCWSTAGGRGHKAARMRPPCRRPHDGCQSI